MRKPSIGPAYMVVCVETMVPGPAIWTGADTPRDLHLLGSRGRVFRFLEIGTGRSPFQNLRAGMARDFATTRRELR